MLQVITETNGQLLDFFFRNSSVTSQPSLDSHPHYRFQQCSRLQSLDFHRQPQYYFHQGGRNLIKTVFGALGSQDAARLRRKKPRKEIAYSNQPAF